MARTYNQECVLAFALDLLGERWTLLIVRELFLGPRRFGDLHTALPGIGTNLLSKRLKELEEAGLVVGGAGDGRNQYRLAPAGDILRPAMREIMLWSIKYFMARPEPSAAKDCIYSNDLQPDSVALALEIFANRCAAPHPNYVLALQIDDNPYTYYFMNNEMTARRGADAPAVARLSADVSVLMQTMRGEATAASDARLAIDGDAEVARHFLESVVPRGDAHAPVGMGGSEAARAASR